MAQLGKDLAVITAGTPDHFNGLTVKYGAQGILWTKDCLFTFVKPERYTWEFMRDNDYFTVCFFPKERSEVYNVYGYKSGRDTDKPKAAGITPEFLEHGVVYEEACEYYVCRKLYMRQMDKSLAPEAVQARYADPSDMICGESHYVIVGEIVEHVVR